MAMTADDEMIVDRNAEGLRDRGDVLGHAYVRG
jgi:hypothetical protein